MPDTRFPQDPNDEVFDEHTSERDESAETPDEEEFEELIIEDFTIDGICGVY